MARSYTVAELKNFIRQRAEMENTQFISDDELLGYINSSTAELNDLLINTFKDYNVTCRILTLSSDQDVYPLPEDFYNIYRVEVSTDNTFNTNTIRLRKFAFQDWNRSTNSIGMGVTGFLYTQYRIVDNNIILMPKPTGVGYMRLWYYPTSKKLKDTSTDANVSGYSTTFTDSSVNVSSDTISITNHGYSASDRVNFQNFGGALPTGISANTDYYAIPTSKNAFKIATTVQNAFDGVAVDITSASGGGTNYITDDLSIYNGQNGWEEYVIVDCAMRCKIKEDLDVSTLGAIKTALTQRILDSGKNRDVSEPDAIRDVTAQSFGFFVTTGGGWV